MADPTSLANAQALYDAYAAAELAVLRGQSYTIGGRHLTRADLAVIQKGRKDAANALQQILATGSNEPRVTRVVPRD